MTEREAGAPFAAMRGEPRKGIFASEGDQRAALIPVMQRAVKLTQGKLGSDRTYGVVSPSLD